MPIEIKELHIRVSVDASAGRPPSGGSTAAGGITGISSKDVKNDIVAECIEQVMHILKNSMER